MKTRVSGGSPKNDKRKSQPFLKMFKASKLSYVP